MSPPRASHPPLPGRAPVRSRRAGPALGGLHRALPAALRAQGTAAGGPPGRGAVVVPSWRGRGGDGRRGPRAGPTRQGSELPLLCVCACYICLTRGVLCCVLVQLIDFALTFPNGIITGRDEVSARPQSLLYPVNRSPPTRPCVFHATERVPRLDGGQGVQPPRRARGHDHGQRGAVHRELLPRARRGGGGVRAAVARGRARRPTARGGCQPGADDSRSGAGSRGRAVSDLGG